MIPPRDGPSPSALQEIAAQIDAALPQTQCTRCGYPDCAAYAQAIAYDAAPINQCPPGGAQGVARLAAITGRPALPLSAVHGLESPRAVAVIDEAWCIGCTLCIKACPTDAIVGSNKMMHTVIEPYCTGCELCIPVCPVDCIALENVSGAATGWAAWPIAQAQQARQRYAAHRERIPPPDDYDGEAQDTTTLPLPEGGAPSGAVSDDPTARKAAIAAAMERARQRAQGPR